MGRGGGTRTVLSDAARQGPISRTVPSDAAKQGPTKELQRLLPPQVKFKLLTGNAAVCSFDVSGGRCVVAGRIV